jgi:capsular polysaccharide transport system ATP-binding protein
MIRLHNISKKFETQHGWNTVFTNVNLQINKGEKVGILGRNGSGKSTLVRILGGIATPDEGVIEKGMSISWPLALSGGFQGSLTGLDNIRFISRLYNANYSEVLEYVKDFSELGSYLYEPAKTYSSGMRGRLAFALSLAIDFDCFLIDEVLSVGDDRFRARCHEELTIKSQNRSIILVSHNPATIKQICNKACVLSDKKLHHFDNLDAAFGFYEGALQ